MSQLPIWPFMGSLLPRLSRPPFKKQSMAATTFGLDLTEGLDNGAQAALGYRQTLEGSIAMNRKPKVVRSWSRFGALALCKLNPTKMLHAPKAPFSAWA